MIAQTCKDTNGIVAVAILVSLGPVSVEVVEAGVVEEVVSV